MPAGQYAVFGSALLDVWDLWRAADLDSIDRLDALAIRIGYTKRVRVQRFWQLWYYLSIIGLFWAGFIYTSSAPCFGQGNQRCNDMSISYTIFVISLALINFFVAYRMYKYGNIISPLPTMKFSWRGDRSFPATFIAFFIFGAVFLGEHLPVIIGFLGNHYSTPDAKPSILDVGGPGDAGVVYVIYAVFGTIVWLLFRYLSWPVILLIGATLGGVAEVFLFINEQNPAEDAVNLANIIGSLIVWGGLISIVPQTIYQKIIRQWGRQGAIIAIAVVVLLNILSIGFFAYQKSVLKRVNYLTTGFPVGICPDRLVDEVGKPSVAHWQGTTYIRLQQGTYEWVNAHCPGVIEHIEQL